MKLLLIAMFAAALPLAVPAQEAGRPQVTIEGPADLDQYLWKARPLVVFADSPEDPRYVEQLQLISDRSADLAVRDVVVLTDTDPAAQSELRRKLRPNGFSLVLIDKKGQVQMRRPSPRDMREIVNAIDKLPLRQQELREKAQRAG